ncbi:MAG: methionyl-tRNA formyltransferase [Minisyncoccia bacterium]
MMKNNILKIAFFGTPDIAVWVLDELEKEGILPSLVITNPDTAQGRKMIVTETPVALWAHAHQIPVYKPVTLKDEHVASLLRDSGCDLFVVAAYGKIIPESILNIPKYQTLNMHPSLLPKLRGASPIRSAILNNVFPTGVSIMILTKGVDEGPILAQEEEVIANEHWPLRGTELDEILARHGGDLLARTIPLWINGEITPCEQTHSEATYSEKLTKEMALINLDDDPVTNLHKIKAFDSWPGAFFFYTNPQGSTIRVKIIDAEIHEGKLNILRIVPEGKKEMNYTDFVRE